jgi:hypothetical protein
MRLSRIAAVGGVSLVALAGAGTAHAAFTVSPNTNLSDGDRVTVQATGISSNIIYIMQCGKNGNADPTFDWTLDCNSSLNENPPVVGGNATGGINVFYGAEPDLGAFTCDENTPCWVRIAPGFPGETNSDDFQQITFKAPGPDPEIPEVPWNVLLPLTAAAALGGGALFASRRRSAKLG